jgi:hypothetical protein
MNDEEFQVKLDEELNGEVEIKTVGAFLKKNLYEGKTIKATIKGAYKNAYNDKKIDLKILVDGEIEELRYGLSPVELQTIGTLFGSNAGNWKNKRISIVFGEKKQYVSNGVQINAVSTKISRI